MRNNILHAWLCAIAVLLASLSSCDTADTAYHHYCDVNQEGWVNRDTLRFSIDTIRRFGDYVTYVCVRTLPDYPYRNLSLTVEQTNITKGKSAGKMRKTIKLNVTDKEGIRQGNGITYHTIEVPLYKNWFGPGDSLRVTVSHNMSRESLPGLMAVGIKLKR